MHKGFVSRHGEDETDEEDDNNDSNSEGWSVDDEAACPDLFFDPTDQSLREHQVNNYLFQDDDVSAVAYAMQNLPSVDNHKFSKSAHTSKVHSSYSDQAYSCLCHCTHICFVPLNSLNRK